MVLITALIYLVFVTVVVLFQITLALGAPWGAYAMGGVHPGTYPPKLRLAALAQGFVLVLTGLIVLIDADLVLSAWKAVAGIAVWFVVALMAVSSMLNLITKSTWERRIWAPVTIVLLITSLIVALG